MPYLRQDLLLSPFYEKKWRFREVVFCCDTKAHALNHYFLTLPILPKDLERSLKLPSFFLRKFLNRVLLKDTYVMTSGDKNGL